MLSPILIFTDTIAVVITSVLVIGSFSVIRELFYAYRKNPEVRKMIPEFLLRHDIISLEDWELSDADRPLNRDLMRALKMWLYTHSPQETDELVYNLAHNYNLTPVDKSDTPQLFFRRSTSKVLVRPFYTSTDELKFFAKSNDDLKNLANNGSQNSVGDNAKNNLPNSHNS